MFKFFLHFRWHGIFLPPASIFFWSTYYYLRISCACRLCQGVLHLRAPFLGFVFAEQGFSALPLRHFDQAFFVVEANPVPYRIFSNIPGLSPLDAISAS